MNTTIRIFLVCAAGALIGSLVGLQMSPHFWWAGLITGAVVGYFGYLFEEAAAAIPIAYRRTVAWRPNRQFLQCWGNWLYGFIHAVVAMLVIPYLILELLAGNSLKKLILHTIGATVVGLFCAVVVASFVTILYWTTVEDERKGNSSYVYKPLEFHSVSRLYVMALREGIKGIVWIMNGIPEAIQIVAAEIEEGAKTVKSFVVLYFTLIHSELRLLCAVDAAIGAAIGYYTGNALVGAIAGGVLGVVNYELITVRWLRLEGATSMFK